MTGKGQDSAGKEGGGHMDAVTICRAVPSGSSPHVCVCALELPQNIPIPSPSPTHQACSSPSCLSPPACLARNKLKNAEPPATST